MEDLSYNSILTPRGLLAQIVRPIKVPTKIIPREIEIPRIACTDFFINAPALIYNTFIIYTQFILFCKFFRISEKNACILNMRVLYYHLSLVGVYDDEGPPVPIPNTVVKLISAENTRRAASREDRSMPTRIKTTSLMAGCFFLSIRV